MKIELGDPADLARALFWTCIYLVLFWAGSNALYTMTEWTMEASRR